MRFLAESQSLKAKNLVRLLAPAHSSGSARSATAGSSAAPVHTATAPAAMPATAAGSGSATSHAAASAAMPAAASAADSAISHAATSVPAAAGSTGGTR